MPERHVRDVPYVKRVSWLELTADERAAVAAVFESFAGVTADREGMRVGDEVGPGAAHGTVLRVPVYAEGPRFPDGLVDELERVVEDAGVAEVVRRVEVLRDPAGEAFHEASGHCYGYRAVVRLHGRWAETRTVEH